MNSEERRAQLATNLATVRSRIAAACELADRDRSEVTLVAVTKTFPVSDVLALAALGVRDIGENRDQEAVPKVAAAAEAGVPLRWHFVGRLQRNKCGSVAGYADLVHSVDRPAVVEALARAAAQLDRRLDVLLQVSLDDDPRRGGVPVPQLAELAALVADRAALRLRGVMTVPPLGAAPEPQYRRFAELAAAVRKEHPEATVVSAGMSSDMQAAIRHGATHVRIGSALLGSRPPLG